MTVEYHYFAEFDQELLQFLQTYGVKHYVSTGHIVFDIRSDNEGYGEFLRKYSDLHAFTRGWLASEEELAEAEWLTMYSTNCKLKPEAWEKTFEYSCRFTHETECFGKIQRREMAYHAKQIGPYLFKTSVKWGRNAFYSAVTGGRETFFCSDRAISVIQNEGLSGLSFMPVKHYKSLQELTDMHQLVFEKIIPDEKIRIQGEQKIWNCPLCGLKKYRLDPLSLPVVSKDCLGEYDFYSTLENYATFSDATRPNAIFVVSQKAYKVLKDNGMTRTLKFLPLIIE